jgi:hypothetical protein
MTQRYYYYQENIKSRRLGDAEQIFCFDTKGMTQSKVRLADNVYNRSALSSKKLTAEQMEWKLKFFDDEVAKGRKKSVASDEWIQSIRLLYALMYNVLPSSVVTNSLKTSIIKSQWE